VTEQRRGIDVSPSAGGADQLVGERLGLKPGMVVQELGWDEDVDDAVRVAIEDVVDGDLVGGGAIWLFSPKVGRPNAVPASDIAEAAPIAGLSNTTTIPISADWAATKLVAPKSR
jgi:hypothetical protein